jgi:adenylate kinase family enzyme
MQRILVIGPCGAGKSTAAVELGRQLDLPVHHLDRLHWRAGWVESSREGLLAALAPIVAGERWLIDDNYGGTMSGRTEERLRGHEEKVLRFRRPRVLRAWFDAPRRPASQISS